MRVLPLLSAATLTLSPAPQTPAAPPVNPREIRFENPSWQAHVVLDGQTPKDNVTLAPRDIDRDGRLDVALGATWKPSDTNGGGTLHWATPGRAGAAAAS